MKIARVATQFQHSMMTLVLLSACPGSALAKTGHSHASTAQPQQLTPAQGALLKVVRDNTERFKDVSVAEAEGYSLLFGCVSGPDAGAMGLHYVNLSLVAAGIVDATRPQIVIYEPVPGGHLQLIGADFLVIARSPNRFGLPAFYTLHVWAWKENPNGAFVNWHPNVSCQAFAGQ